MTASRKRWIIKNSEGLLKGPYTTDQVMRRINRGDFGGDEMISEYPGANWYPISKDPNFYDRLLAVLSDQRNHSGEDFGDVAPPPDSENEITSTPPPDTSPAQEVHLEMEETEAEAQPIKSRAIPTDEGKKKKKKTSKPKNDGDIEMVDIDKRAKEEVRRGIWKPAILAAGVLALGVYFLMDDPESSTEERIHLLAPQKSSPKLSAEQGKEKVRRGTGEYLRDTFSSYVRAQNELVQAIENAPPDAEAMSLLCLTYYELWPFTYQDSDDMRAITSVTQMASAIDGSGTYASTCKVVDLMLKGRYQEALSLSRTVLEKSNGQLTSSIPFYYFMAILYEANGDPTAAITYLTSAQSEWPSWIRAYSYQAQLYSKTEKYSEAAQLYRSVLKAQPDHDISKIELGILEAKQFRNPDKGIELINAGLNSRERVPKRILSRGHLSLAELNLNRRDTAQALKHAKMAYSLDSTNTVAKNLVIQLGGTKELSKTQFKSYQLIAEGDQLAREGDCNSAQGHFKTAFEVDPKSGVAAMKAAECLWRLSLSTEAIDWLNKAVRADPKLIEAYVTLADYYSQRYNFAAAAQVLQAAQQIAPKSYEVYRGYAMVELRRNNPKGAVDSAKQALAIYDIDVESHVLTAEAQVQLGNFSQAFMHASRAREIDVNHRGAQVAYGRALQGVQGAEAAIDYFIELVKIFPVISEYRLALGKLYMAEQRYSEAQQTFSDLTRIDEKSKEAFLELGKCLRVQAQYEQALAAFQQAAILDPSDAEPMFQMGQLYLELRKPVEAQIQLQRVVRINKLFPLVHYNIGRAAFMAGDLTTALNEAKEERNVNPGLAEPYLLAAEIYAGQQQYSLCVTEYQKAIKLRPQSASNYIRMAICYRKGDQLDVAIQMLNQAAVLESGLPNIYKELGAIYETKGDLTEAAKSYCQYFVLDPNAPDRSSIEKRFLGRLNCN